jgi:hypothetical protein
MYSLPNIMWVIKSRRVNGRIILRWMGGMDWIDLAQDMERWKTLVNTLMNLWVP